MRLHTINPPDDTILKYSDPEENEATSSIVVKELKDVHPTLNGEDKVNFLYLTTERQNTGKKSHFCNKKIT